MSLNKYLQGKHLMKIGLVSLPKTLVLPAVLTLGLLLGACETEPLYFELYNFMFYSYSCRRHTNACIMNKGASILHDLRWVVCVYNSQKQCLGTGRVIIH